MTKRVLVLGATGRTGSHVVEKALAAGLAVNILARNPDAVTHNDENLTLFKGTPEHAADIGPAMAGCTGVICTLNNRRASDSPFAKIVNSPTLLTDCFANIIDAMQQNGVRRVIQLGASGAGDSFATAPWLFRMMIKHASIGVAYKDHEGVEAALAASGLDWTVGRAVGLGKKTGTVIESHATNGKMTPKPSMTIARDCVAHWMIDALDRSDLHGKTPTISIG